MSRRDVWIKSTMQDASIPYELKRELASLYPLDIGEILHGEAQAKREFDAAKSVDPGRTERPVDVAIAAAE